MTLEIPSISDFMSKGQALSEKMREASLNRLYAQPERQAGLNKLNMSNQFYPLQQAISAQNALSYQNTRSNPASDYLRAIANMPAKQRELYLSYPDNQKTYQNMINMAQQKMEKGNVNQNVLTPEMAQSYFQNTPQNMLMPQQMSPQNMLVPQPIQQNQQLPPRQAPPMSQSINAPSPPVQNAPKINEPKQTVDQIPATLEEAPEALPPITSIDPGLAMQYQQNLANVDTNIKQRLSGAVVIDKFLMDNRKQINDSINAASKYASYWGMVAKKKDEFLSSIMNKDPKGYTDLMWYETAFIPHMSNGIKVMERLSATNAQREELHEMSDSIINHRLNSKQAKELFNKQIGTIFDISDAVIQTAEPIHKGVTRNVFNMPKLKGDYLQESITKTGKTYSSSLGESIKDLIKNGNLTKKYYLSLKPEQRAAVRKQLEKDNG